MFGTPTWNQANRSNTFQYNFTRLSIEGHFLYRNCRSHLRMVKPSPYQVKRPFWMIQTSYFPEHSAIVLPFGFVQFHAQPCALGKLRQTDEQNGTCHGNQNWLAGENVDRENDQDNNWNILKRSDVTIFNKKKLAYWMAIPSELWSSPLCRPL